MKTATCLSVVQAVRNCEKDHWKRTASRNRCQYLCSIVMSFVHFSAEKNKVELVQMNLFLSFLYRTEMLYIKYIVVLIIV